MSNVGLVGSSLFFKSSLEDIFSLLLKREEGKKRNTDVREKNRQERETLIGCFPYVSRLGIELATQVCILTGNQTCNLSFMG